MLCLNRNKQKIYYSLYLEQTDSTDSDGYETGENPATYSEPIELMVNVSPPSGKSNTMPFGNYQDYDRVLVLSDVTCPIDENALLYIDRVPAEGVQPNYIVKRVSRSLNSLSIAVKRIEVG